MSDLQRRLQACTVAGLTALAALLPSPRSASAQSPESPLLRGGQVRLEMLPEIRIWNERYGGTAEPFDELEPWAADFILPQVDPSFLPPLADIQSSLRDLLADPDLVADLGSTRARMQANRTEIPLGLAVGVFDWLTVGVRVPFVRRRVEVDWALDPTDATLGRSPGIADASVQTWLAELGAVIDHVAALVDERCTTLGAADPACVRGQEAVSTATMLSENLADAWVGLFFVRAGTSAAGRLGSRVDAVADLLRQEGDPTFIDQTWVTPLPFATGPAQVEDLQTLVTDPAYGVTADPVDSQLSLWEMGDVEVSAALRVFERLPARDPSVSDSLARAGGGGVGVLLGVGATYRLGTGQPDLAFDFVDLGSGDGQDDLEAMVFGRLDLGARIRTRFEARYGVQQEGERIARVGPPEQPIRLLATQRTLLWDPGDYLDLMVAPELRIAPELSLGLRYRYYSKGADAWSLPAGAEPDAVLPPLEVLSRETEVTVQHLGIGATLWPSPRSRARDQWPLAVSAEYQLPLGGQGGMVPRDARFRVSARLFVTLW
ncbi:MAG: hypothetical protein KC645_17120 [Gemmatimonadetes bacterium]|nr:hypothetical protein [Gemmatimonadota bacterium]